MTEITVKKNVPYDERCPDKCYEGGDFWGRDCCHFHVRRDRTHGNRAPVERKLPKCTLFDTWLKGEYERCPECTEAIRKSREEEAPHAKL